MKEFTVSYWQEEGNVATVFAKNEEEAEKYVRDMLYKGEQPEYISYNETVHRDYGILEVRSIEVNNAK